ncbi:hypothetical protein PBC5_gp26 [Sinorhizobium phage PBC5]|uniref:hypothetical protein n=1 Tax=Sinorhizobium phage PBC5 TaxID=179237 RepID=UPI001BE7B6D6|nr:hypothetical protein PBC5_gp26 [Sinorhizobium phage PBC5]
MLRLTVKMGQAVNIEGVGTIHVIEKSGRCVSLGFETELGPIRLVPVPDLSPVDREA